MSTHMLTAVDTLTVMLAAVVALATWFDVRQRRIPNWLTVGGTVAVLVLRGFVGMEALGAGLMGGALGLLLGLFFFAIGAMGAGDGKLLAAVGAGLGFGGFVQALPLIGVAGGVLALLVTIRAGTIVPTLLRFQELGLHVLSFGRIGERRTLATPGAVTMPYGVAVAAGVVWTLLVVGITP